MVKIRLIAREVKRFWGRATVLLLLMGFVIAGLPQGAEAMTQIKLSNVEANPCPAEMAEGSVTSDGSGRPADCYLISGVATNTTSKVVYDADVFGRVYDSGHNSVMENRTRLGLIPEVPPGDTDFSIRISVPASLEPPLILEQFRSSGFGSTVRMTLPSSDFSNDYFDELEEEGAL